MASRLVDVYSEQGNHVVGNLNSWKIRVMPYGAIVDSAPIDNFTWVELDFNEDGERICKQLSDVEKKGYLIAAPEKRYISGEQMCDFYNAVGEHARIVLPDLGVRFETSAYALNEGVTEMKNGMVAHFDPKTKKYIVSDAAAPHADYEKAANQFMVVATDMETDLIDDQSLVRLEIEK